MTFVQRNFIVVLFSLFGGLSSVPAQATVIQEITSPQGMHAWLVEDHKLPIVDMAIAFRGGVEQDPSDKQGLCALTAALLTEGAGNYDAATFQQTLSEKSISIGFDAGRDAITGHARFLSADQAKAFELLRLALSHPRFDQADIDRLRTEYITAVRDQFGSPEWQGRNALLQEIFVHHPYSMRHLGSEKSLNAISRDDIRHFAADHLARANLVVAVAGDIKPDDLAAMLDKVFGDLPNDARLTPVTDAAWPAQLPHIVVTREGTQTGVLFAWHGPKRNDPDWYALEVANYVLGGGGFASRLMQEVRDKRGLTYGIGTHLSAMEHAGMIVGEAAIDNAKVAEAWRVAHDTMQEFYEAGITQTEMNAAKDYLTGAMPMAMTSTEKAAGTMLSLQLEHLGTHYLDDYPGLIRALTVEQINQAIRRWFNPDAIAFSMVGKPEGLADTTSKPMVRE